MQDEQSLGDAADVIEDEESQPSEDDLPGTEYQQNRKKKNKEEEKGCLTACKEACPCWVAFSNRLRLIVVDEPKGNINAVYFERSIIILIGLNTLFMASEHYEQPDWLTVA